MEEMIESEKSEELLILVDKVDRIMGFERRGKCHEGEGLLHRAFYIFLFNDRNELLLQKRSANKLLWPLFWSNSVCVVIRERGRVMKKQPSGV